MRMLIPKVGDQRQYRPATNADHAVEDSLGATASNRDRDLPPNLPITTVEGRRFSHDHLVQRENDRALARPGAAF